MEKVQFEKYNQIDSDVEIRVVFDQSNSNWHNDQEYNHFFVKHVMSFMQDKCMARGSLFVNEVLDYLGIPRTPEGQLLGWNNFGERMDFSFTSDSEGGRIVLKNAKFIWHTL
jgi:hypothetical protein